MAIIDAATILKEVFGNDSLYMFGGDEFIGILNTCSEIEIKEFFNKLDHEIIVYNSKIKVFKLPPNIYQKDLHHIVKKKIPRIERCLKEPIPLCIMIKRFTIKIAKPLKGEGVSINYCIIFVVLHFGGCRR